MNENYTDLTGLRFGLLTIIEKSRFPKRKDTWRFRCECGNTNSACYQSLTGGLVKCCNNCYNKYYSNEDKIIRELFMQTRYNKNGMLYNFFKKIMNDPCFHCGAYKSNTFKSKTGETIKYNGIDRLDSTIKKYEDCDNLVACCVNCNIAKNSMNVNDFYLLIKNIINNKNNKSYLIPKSEEAERIGNTLICNLNYVNDAYISKKLLSHNYFLEDLKGSNIVGKVFGKLTVINQSKSINQRTAWLCKCECGNECIIKQKYLINNDTKSCGCLSKCRDYLRKKHPMVVSINTVFKDEYSDGDLTINQFYYLSQQNCHYCNAKPSNNRKSGRGISEYEIKNCSFIYNGLDRINNNLIHNYSNVVPCCKNCNFAKGTKDVDSFLNWVDKVYLHNKIDNGIIYV